MRVATWVRTKTPKYRATENNSTNSIIKSIISGSIKIDRQFASR